MEGHPPEEFLTALAELGGDGGTQEVADAVGAKYQVTYRKLRALEDDGKITRRKVGNANLWMKDL